MKPLNRVPRGHAHAMVVTGQGVDAMGRSYLVVSSWGGEYRIYLGTMHTGAGEYIILSGVSFE